MTSPTRLIDRAVRWSADLHAHQHRKVSGAPYIAHLLGAAGVAAAVSQDDVVVAAALLHDAIEDQQATRADAIAALGPEHADEVWDIVEQCTDIAERGRFSWHERKQHYLDGLDELAEGDDPNFVRRATTVAIADKLYNARSIEHELRTEGAAAFDRMKGGADSIEWYLPGLAERLERLAVGTGDLRVVGLAAEFRDTVQRIREMYAMLPTLERDIRIGRAIDISRGIDGLEIVDANGRSHSVSVVLAPVHLPKGAAHSPALQKSRAAADRDAFPDAITRAAVRSIQRTTARGSYGRLGHAFNAAAVALEHGASTTETCAVLIMCSQRQRLKAPFKPEDFQRDLGDKLGGDVSVILNACREFRIDARQGAPMLGARKRFEWVSRRHALRRSMFTVLASDQMARATSLESRLQRMRLDVIAANPPAELEAMQRFVVACRREFDGTLAADFADIVARINLPFAVARELTPERLSAVGPGSGTFRIYAADGSPFVFESPDGSRYRADIMLRPGAERLLPTGTDLVR